MSCFASSLYESRPYGLPAPCQARHQANSIVTSPTGTALISAPQRGVKGAIAPTAPGREPKNAPAEAGENSPRGNCVPPCRATASPSHRTRPPLWACGPPIRLKAVGSPCWLSRKEGLNPPRCAQEKENRLPGLPGGPGRGDQSCGQGYGRACPFAWLAGAFKRLPLSGASPV
jgi:hypothetical protein